MTVTGRHILFLTDNFPPELSAPASRTFEHCSEWVRQGYRVTVVTSNPNFPEGRLHPGHANRLWRSETIAGMRVIRVWTYIAPNVGFAKRVLDFLTYMMGATVAGLFVRRVDLVIGTSPHLFVAVAAMILGWIKRVPYVFELRDLWPESIRAVGAMTHGRVIALLERLELFLYRRAALVVALTHSFKSDLVRRGVPADKIRVITNGADLRRFGPGQFPTKLAHSLGLEDRFVAGYIGTHGMAHGLTTLLDAAEMVLLRPGGEDVVFLLVGQGAEREALRWDAEQRGLSNVRFLDPVAKDAVADYWRLLDVAIIHVRRHVLFETVIPSKTFEAMAVGTPILHGVRGESADIVRRTGAGILFEPEDACALADLVLRVKSDPTLRAELSRNGVAAAPEYDRQNLARAMLRDLEKLIRRGRAIGHGAARQVG